MTFGVGVSPQELLKLLEDNWKTAFAISGWVFGAGSFVLNFLRHGRETDQVKEQRFQGILPGLRSGEVDANAAVATQLLEFLREKGHEAYYKRIFDIAVTHFRNRVVADPENPKLNVVDEAFVSVFAESTARLRKKLTSDKVRPSEYAKYLDASKVHLEGANLFRADLRGADLSEANLSEAGLSRVNLSGANLLGAVLLVADLSGTELILANLSEAFLGGANLTGADLTGADLIEAVLRGDIAYLSGADLQGANLSETDLSGADLLGVNITDAADLRGANLYETKGLNPEQLQKCIEMGAILEAPGPKG